MTWWLAMLAASATAAVDCEPPAAADPPDAALSRVYVQVGEEELAAGNHGAAAAAFREALRLGAPDEGLLPRFTASCSQAQGRGLAWAVDAVGTQGCSSAEPVLAAFSAQGDPSAQLLHGICLFEAGRDGEALRALELAAKAQDLAPHARLFMGLAAARLGERGRAITELELVQGSTAGELRSAATRLLRTTRRRGIISFLLSAHGGVDTNVDLAPLGSAAAQNAADGVGVLRALVEVRPNRDRTGPFLLLSGSLRKQAEFVAFDGYAGGVNAGYVLVGRRLRASVDYGLDALYLNAAPYATRHAVSATGTWFFERLWLTGSYRPQLTSFAPPSVRKWSGARHTGQLDFGWAANNWLNAWTGYRGARELTRGQAYASTLHGPSVGASALVLDRLQAVVRGQVEWRVFDLVDPAFKVVREDVAFDVSAGAEYRVSSFVGLNVDVTYRRAHSTIPALVHEQVLATVGLSVGGGLL